MITWLLFIFFNPVGTANIYAAAMCGVFSDLFLLGQICQKLEKVLDHYRK